MSAGGRGARRPRRTGPALPKVVGVRLGNVIAARRLESASDPDVAVAVEIGRPRKTRGLDEYRCPYRINGKGDERVRAAYGVDAVQALQLALRAIGSVLASRKDLRFLGNRDLGFPDPSGSRP